MAQACIVFEDQLVDRLRPMNLARPTCGITCGALSLMGLLQQQPWETYYHVRPYLRGLLEQQGHHLSRELEGMVLFLNAALLPDLKTLARITELVKVGEPFLALNEQRVTVALCPNGFPADMPPRGAAEIRSFILDQRLPIIEDEFTTLDYSFDVIRHHEQLLPTHLNYLVDRGKYQKITGNVYAGRDCQIASNVVLDGSDGIILMGDNVTIRPFSYVAGPVRVGDKTLVIDHASIKHGTVLGHTVKAGGELEATIVEPYSNKQHHGFLGHAYVGSWVNLGAGTSNSDLKNTYGELSIDFEGRHVATGMQFLGCIIGDYTKTAINTSILTGKLIGVASFLYGFISVNVPSFTNFARSFGQVTEVSVEVAIKTQTRAGQRRKVAMTPIDTLLMQELFELTRPERQLSSEQVVL